MADRITPEQRRRCMSHVKGKDTKPEILVRKALFRNGFRYRINVKGMTGRPDIVLRKYHTAIFVNGCFWHGHNGCKKAKLPETNEVFWRNKIESNVRRDIVIKRKLEEEGWCVIVVWECELTKDIFEQTISNVVSQIKTNAVPR